tara:strand:+ start:6663 stop:7520 length:858 start_codon:yes stop_codon:yes gene_type:complete
MDNISINNVLPASIVTAVLTKTLISPITRVKVLQQIQSYHSTYYYNNPIKAIKYIYNNEGLRGFYKGNLMNISKSIPNYALKFPLNDYYLTQRIKNSNYKTVKDLPFRELLIAGLLTGVLQTSCGYPLDVLRTRVIQDNNMNTNKNTLLKSTFKFIKHEGVISMYKGIVPAMLTTPVYIGIQLAMYQYLKNGGSFFSNSLIAGGCAGIISQSIMYPGDTIKHHMQINGMNNKTRYNGTIDCILKIYKHYGISGFYKGILLNSIKAVPEIAFKFTIYEYSMRMFNI